MTDKEPVKERYERVGLSRAGPGLLITDIDYMVRKKHILFYRFHRKKKLIISKQHAVLISFDCGKKLSTESSLLVPCKNHLSVIETRVYVFVTQVVSLDFT